MATSITVNSAKELSEILEKLLSKWPLYRKLVYAGERLHFTKLAGMHGTTPFDYGELPSELTMFCDSCDKEQRWKSDKTEVYFRDGFHDVQYFCKNCSAYSVTYFFKWFPTKEGGVFYKVGQFPPLENFFQIEPLLKRCLDDTDLKLFRQALITRNSNFGIGSVSYLRRVVEHALNRLMDLIAETVTSSGVDLSELPVMKSRRAEDRIAYASKILPDNLKQGGHNPLDLLYGLFSEGLHGKTDEECVDVLDEALFVFEYLFRNLGRATEEAKQYRDKLGSLARRAADKTAGPSE
jgi:hypothetical protein